MIAAADLSRRRAKLPLLARPAMRPRGAADRYGVVMSRPNRPGAAALPVKAGLRAGNAPPAVGFKSASLPEA
jgi:hypothetical protein